MGFQRKIIIFIFCFNICFACSGDDKNNVSNLELVSVTPADNETIDVSIEEATFTFNLGIYVADKAKITQNGVPVAGASTYGTSLTVNLNALEYGAGYALIIEKGALKDGYGNLNAQSFSLSFRTGDAPVAPILMTSVSQNGFLSVKGTSLVNEKGQPGILRGVSFGWHNWWPRFYNENTVAWLKNDWKCGVVRAAIGVEPDGAYIDNPEQALTCLYAVVDAAIKNDMYIIIDWHSHNIRLEEAQNFFSLVAQKYKNYPNIIYEIFNEPEIITWGEVKAYSEAVIKTIREIDSKNIILVGSPLWDQAVDQAAADPITGYDNLMYTLHFYAATHKQSLRDTATSALQKGLPLFVSECAGMEASGDGDINMQEWNSWLQWMNANGVSWVAWSIADKNESCSMIKSTSSPVSGWTENDLKEWGRIVRNELIK